MKPKFDKRTFMKIKGCKDPAQLFNFLEQIYLAGYKDASGVEADLTLSYKCGNCGGGLDDTIEARFCYHCGAELDFSEVSDE